MSDVADLGRRRFLGGAAMTVAASRLGVLGSALQQIACGTPSLAAGNELSSLSNATTWLNSPALTPAGLQGRVVHRFHARDLHLVMGPASRGTSVRFRVRLDGRPPGAARGLDVDEGGAGTVDEQRMYQLVRQPGRIGDRSFEIEFLDPGVAVFSFTFG